jgi:hypothetical protein
MRITTACVLALVATSALGAEAAPWNHVSRDALRAHTEFLADDLLEGRGAASRGYDLAAAYVAAQLRQYSIKHAGDGDTYFQRVPLVEATPVLPGSSARLVRDDETIDFEYGTDYLPSADFTSASSTLTAPLVFVGYGIDAPELDHNDFADIDVEGRIAIVLSGAPATFPNNQRAYHSSRLRKWSTIAEKGAVGLITISSLVDSKRYPWERVVAMSWAPQMRWLDPEGTPQDAYPELKLRFQFNERSAEKLFEPGPMPLSEVLAAADAGEPPRFELPGMMTLSSTTGLRKTESTNVVGVLEGSDPKLKEEFIVVTAHLDHLGRGSSVDGDSIYNGAHDNAVGIAMLLEMARALDASRNRPKRSILFAAVTAEEKGLLGSDFLARAAKAQGRTIVANLNLDMPLTFTRTHDFVAFGAEHSSLGAAARNAAQAEGFRLSPDPNPEEVVFVRSDQFSFIRQGVPALMLHSGSQPRDGAVDLAELRQTFYRQHYHQPSDDTSLPIDYDAAADLTRIHLRILLEAANGPRPRWKRGDFFGETFRSQD